MKVNAGKAFRRHHHIEAIYSDIQKHATISDHTR